MKNKIGIVLPYQNGDLITATSVIKYREELWPNCDIVWFCNEPHSEALKFQDIEIRYFPHGWDILQKDITGQYSERVRKDKADGKPEWEDWSVLKNSSNRLIQELKDNCNSMKDLYDAYFPAPWMLMPNERHGLEYTNVSKKVFEVPNDLEWHPVLKFSDDERMAADTFMFNPKKKKQICIETFAGSSQSKITDNNIRRAMEICNEVLGECEFIFMSHKYLRGTEDFPADFYERSDISFAKRFTVRQCALIVGQSDLLISVSSGITVAASCWGNNPVPVIQLCGSKICSTSAIALGRFELVTTDNQSPPEAAEDFYSRLTLLLNEIK